MRIKHLLNGCVINVFNKLVRFSARGTHVVSLETSKTELKFSVFVNLWSTLDKGNVFDSYFDNINCLNYSCS